MGEGLFVDGAVDFPVLGHVAGERAEGDAHRETSGVGAGCRWTTDELELERVGFAGHPSIGHIVKNHLNGVVCDFVVAQTARFCDVVDVNLAGGTLVRLWATDAPVIGGGEGREEEQHPNEREEHGAGRERRFVHGLTLSI